MKKLSVIFCFTILLLSFMDLESKGSNFPYSIGPFITLKGGVNAANVPDGIKNGFTINGLPDFGVSGYIPFGEKSQFGLAADLAYSTYAYDMKTTSFFESVSTIQISYFTFSPNIFIYGFTTGLNFGIPLGGKTTSSNFEIDIKSDEVNILVEFRIGGMIPLYYDETGRVNLIVQFGYSITEQSKENYSNSYNYHPASGALGVSYLFNLSE